MASKKTFGGLGALVASAIIGCSPVNYDAISETSYDDTVRQTISTDMLESDSLNSRFSYEEWKEGVLVQDEDNLARQKLHERGQYIVTHFKDTYAQLSEKEKNGFEFFKKRMTEELGAGRIPSETSNFNEEMLETRYGLKNKFTKEELTDNVQLLLYLDLRHTLQEHKENGEIASSFDY